MLGSDGGRGPMQIMTPTQMNLFCQRYFLSVPFGTYLRQQKKPKRNLLDLENQSLDKRPTAWTAHRAGGWAALARPGQGVAAAAVAATGLLYF